MTWPPPDVRYRYAREQLWLALDELVSAENVRVRLFKAFVNHLHPLHRNNFPEDLYKMYEEVREAMSWVPVEREGEGTLASTLRQMTEDEAQELALKLVKILYELEHYEPPDQ
jgi:hypothetical protein